MNENSVIKLKSYPRFFFRIKKKYFNDATLITLKLPYKIDRYISYIHVIIMELIMCEFIRHIKRLNSSCIIKNYYNFSPFGALLQWS